MLPRYEFDSDGDDGWAVESDLFFVIGISNLVHIIATFLLIA
ncbi:hypothetical protein AT1219_11164 [Vibrio alginolyticus]